MSPERFSEDELVERPSVELLAELGWQTVNAYDERLGAGGTLGRDSRRDVVLGHRLLTALSTLNPDAPATALEEAAAAVARDRAAMDPVRANSEVYALLRDGYLAVWRDDTGNDRSARIAYVDWRDPAQNDLLAANQVWIDVRNVGTHHIRGVMAIAASARDPPAMTTSPPHHPSATPPGLSGSHAHPRQTSRASRGRHEQRSRLAMRRVPDHRRPERVGLAGALVWRSRRPRRRGTARLLLPGLRRCALRLA